jgi:hypothetical protein
MRHEKNFRNYEEDEGIYRWYGAYLFKDITITRSILSEQNLHFTFTILYVCRPVDT